MKNTMRVIKGLAFSAILALSVIAASGSALADSPKLTTGTGTVAPTGVTWESLGVTWE